MECNITKNNIYSCKTVFENFSEEKVDLDIVIPDYCAAAVRILKCEAQPVITSKSVDGDRLMLEGVCNVNVMYTDEMTGAVKSISESANFSQSWALKEQLSDYRIKIKLRTANVSCRLQNSRKISVKAVIGIAAKVMGNAEHTVIDCVEDCGIETLFEHADVCTYVGCGMSDIHISGETGISSDALDVIKCDGCMSISEIKPIKDKVIVKGEAAVSCLYTTGEGIGELESVRMIIPFNEIVDVEACEENSIAQAECEIINIRCDISGDPGSNAVSFEIEGCISSSVYNSAQINLLKDAYSTNGEAECSKSVLSIESLLDNMIFTENIRDSIELDIDEARIADIMLKPVIKNVSPAEGGLRIDGEINVSVYAYGNDEYRFFEKPVAFSVTKAFTNSSANMRCEALACVKDISFTMPDDSKLEFKADMELNLLVFSNTEYDIIDNIDVSDDAEKKRCSKVVIYYADKGESLWNIAKKYHSTVNIIKRDNTVDESVMPECKMLLISSN